MNENSRFWLAWWLIIVMGIIAISVTIGVASVYRYNIKSEIVKSALQSGQSLAAIECADSHQIHDKEYLRICLQK